MGDEQHRAENLMASYDDTYDPDLGASPAQLTLKREVQQLKSQQLELSARLGKAEANVMELESRQGRLEARLISLNETLEARGPHRT